MKRIIFTVVAVAIGLALAAPAFADSTHTCQGNSCNGGAGDVSAGAVSTSAAVSSSQSNAVGVGIGHGGNASATAHGGKGGNASADSVNIVAPVQQSSQSYEGSYTGSQSVNIRTDVPRQAPSLGVSGDVSNMTCFAHAGGGVTSPFGGASLMLPRLDDGCDSRAWAIFLYQIGQRDAAMRLAVQQSDKVRAAFAEPEPATSSLKNASLVAPLIVPASAIFAESVQSVERFQGQ